MHRVLVVEDSAVYRELFRNLLTPYYEVQECDTGSAGIDLARAWQPDVVVLDLTLPDLDGMAVCTSIRSFSSAFIVMVTARGEIEARLEGLDLGADDYLAKPFDGRELLTRLRVLLRRPRPTTGEIIELGDLSIDCGARIVRVGGVELSPTKIEFDMLLRLARDPGRPVSREQLSLAAWGPSWVGANHVINVHVANLRKKVDDDGGSRIQAVRGIGYRYVANGADEVAA